MAYRGCDLILSCHEAETDHAQGLPYQRSQKEKPLKGGDEND